MTAASSTPEQMTRDEWVAEAHRRFGDNPADWRFVCPVCGNEASGAEFKAAGAKADAMYQECIGRYTEGRSALFGGDGPGPCDYAAFGLIQLAPLRVTVGDDEAKGETVTLRVVHVFAFGEARKEGAA